jgi:hypothetical protein
MKERMFLQLLNFSEKNTILKTSFYGEEAWELLQPFCTQLNMEE